MTIQEKIRLLEEEKIHLAIDNAYVWGYETGYIDGEWVSWENGWNDGYAEGEQFGLETGYAAGKEDGFSQGYDEGYNTGCDEGIAQGKEQGYHEGYDEHYNAFWDIFQQYGERTFYPSAFCYGWTNENFNPKYDIRPTGDYGDTCMFQYTKGLNLVDKLEENGVSLDMSQATRFNQTFDRCDISIIPPIDASSCNAMNMTFYNCTATKITIDNIKENCTFDRTFNYMTRLVELNITGTIGQNGINLSGSTLLTKESILSIVAALSLNITETKTITFNTSHQSIIETNADCKPYWEAAKNAGWSFVYAS